MRPHPPCYWPVASEGEAARPLAAAVAAGASRQVAAAVGDGSRLAEHAVGTLDPSKTSFGAEAREVGPGHRDDGVQAAAAFAMKRVGASADDGAGPQHDDLQALRATPQARLQLAEEVAQKALALQDESGAKRGQVFLSMDADKDGELQLTTVSSFRDGMGNPCTEDM